MSLSSFWRERWADRRVGWAGGEAKNSSRLAAGGEGVRGMGVARLKSSRRSWSWIWDLGEGGLRGGKSGRSAGGRGGDGGLGSSRRSASTASS